MPSSSEKAESGQGVIVSADAHNISGLYLSGAVVLLETVRKVA